MHIQIASVFGRSVHFIFKTCQIVAGTSMIRQFHELFNLIFGGFLTFGTTVQSACLDAAAKKGLLFLRSRRIAFPYRSRTMNSRHGRRNYWGFQAC